MRPAGGATCRATRAGRARGKAPDAVRDEGDGHEDEPEEQELQGHVAPARIGELRQHRRHEDRGLGVGDADDVPFRRILRVPRGAVAASITLASLRLCRIACTPRNTTYIAPTSLTAVKSVAERSMSVPSPSATTTTCV